MTESKGPLAYDVVAWRQGEILVPGFGGARLTIGDQTLEMAPLTLPPDWREDTDEARLRRRAMGALLAEDVCEQLRRMTALEEDLPGKEHIALPACLASTPAIAPWLTLQEASAGLWGAGAEAGVILFGRAYPLVRTTGDGASSSLALKCGATYALRDARQCTRWRFVAAHEAVLRQAAGQRLADLRRYDAEHVEPVMRRCAGEGRRLCRYGEWTVLLWPDGAVHVKNEIGRFCVQHSDGRWYKTPGSLIGEAALAAGSVENLMLGRVPFETLLGAFLRVSPHYRHPYVNDGSVCFGGRHTIMQNALHREGLVRESRLLIAMLRAASHLMRRGIVDTGEGISPYRNLPESDFTPVTLAEANASGLTKYPFKRDRLHV